MGVVAILTLLVFAVAFWATASTRDALHAPQVRFAAVGDTGRDTPTARSVAERIAAVHRETPLDTLLLLGDLDQDDGNGDDYEANFATPYRPVLDAEIPLAAALGNHDVHTREGADMMQLFEMPGRYYDFRIGPVAFFALDTTAEDDGTRLDNTQLSWLRSKLEATSAPWRVLFMHHPSYSTTDHSSQPEVRRALEPIVNEYGVQLVLSGHDHQYERSKQIGSAVYVVAGTGCCVDGKDERSDHTAHFESTGGIVVVEASTTRMVLRFVDAEGGVRDSAEIRQGEKSGAA